MRALGFEAKKTDVLKILKDCDHQSTGKIVFSDFQDVSECQSCVLFTCMLSLVMVALCNRADRYIFILFLSSFFLSSSFFPRLISAVDVYHTSEHGVALVRI